MQPVPGFLDLVAVHGPWLLFLLAIAETSFVTGLVVPSGLATSVATALALEEGVSLLPVVAAAGLGGAIGDSLGFWIGHEGGRRWLEGQGRLSGRFRAAHARASRFFGHHAFLSVTLARLVSFVRTIMPMAAGMSSLRYRAFIPYDLAGVALWCALYMLLGAAAEEGWERAERIMGLGGAAALAAGAVALWWVTRRTLGRSRGRARRGAP